MIINISKRKLESYRRAEVVAQASRLVMTNPRSQEATDLWSAACLDWMTVTGKKHKYATPRRRGRWRSQC